MSTLIEKIKSNPQKTISCLFIFGLFVFGIYLRLIALDGLIINEYTARDLERTFNLFDGEYFPLVGSEVMNGGRLPGPFLYILLSVPLLFHYSYESIFVFNIILNLGSILFFFFVVKKHFGFFISVLSTALVLVNIPLIGAIAQPMNPAFLFPFLVFYLWFILEFVTNRRSYSFLFIILILSLSVQLHYSMATYVAVLISTMLILRIKISFKTGLAASLIIMVCFAPNVTHQKKMFTPMSGGEKILKKPDVGSLQGVIKIFTIQNVLKRFEGYNTHRSTSGSPSKMVGVIFHLITWVGFFFISAFVFYSIRKGGVRSCQKEITLLILFYIPAIIYELLSLPTSPSATRYLYIFIFPQAVIVSIFANFLYIRLQSRYAKSFMGITGGFLFGVVLLGAHDEISALSKKNSENLLDRGFAHQKILFGALMEEIGLTPDEYLDRVYLNQDITISSSLLNLIYRESGKAYDLREKSKLPCYYIRDAKLLSPGTWEHLKHVIFYEDTSIKTSRTFDISMSKYGIPKVFKVYEYLPVSNQSCYRNSLNEFVIDKVRRNMLKDSKGINPSFELDVKVIKVDENYDSQAELKSYEGHFIAYSKFLESPFRFKLLMSREGDDYRVKGEVESHHVYPGLRYVSFLDVNICPREGITRSFKSCDKINILPRNTLASVINTYNKSWFKETVYRPKHTLIKEKTFLVLNWSVSKISRVDSLGRYSTIWEHNVLPLNGKSVFETLKAYQLF
jgi:hypothetical protein